MQLNKKLIGILFLLAVIGALALYVILVEETKLSPPGIGRPDPEFFKGGELPAK